jgi:cbb3-type cytochrome oxidase subunit 3
MYKNRITSITCILWSLVKNGRSAADYKKVPAIELDDSEVQ